jgi:hypothetical protein
MNHKYFKILFKNQDDMESLLEYVKEQNIYSSGVSKRFSFIAVCDLTENQISELSKRNGVVVEDFCYSLDRIPENK